MPDTLNSSGTVSFFSFSMLNFMLFFQATNGAQSLALPVCSKRPGLFMAELCNRIDSN